MVTVITKTIGPTGRDYATFTFAEADVTNVGTSGDLVANDEAIVFEADAGDYSETLNFDTSGGLTCDATRNVTWTHATGAGHGGQFEAGANLVGSCNMREDHAVVDGLSVSPSSGGAAGIFSAPEGVFLRNMMVYSTNSYAIRLDRGATAAFPGVVENCVCKSDSLRPFDIRSEGSGVDAHWRVINTTVFTAGTNVAFQVGSSSSDTLNLELTNVLVLGARAFFAFGGATLVLTGSNNFGPATNPFPAAIQGSPYPITATTSFSTPLGSGDYAVYMGSNGSLANVTGNDVWQQGVGPGSNASVPTTDINGVARSGASCNPGAFEADGFVAPTVTTQTIGPTGRDYATFTLAEASLPAEDITFTNRAFVFEADAATYAEVVNFSSSLTTDATRQVTYKPAAGSEHGGSAGSGVRVTSSGNTFNASDRFIRLEGLVVETTGAFSYGLVTSSEGGTVDACIVQSSGTACFLLGQFPGPAAQVVTNCVAVSGAAYGFYIYQTGVVQVTNCTVLQSNGTAIRIQASGTTPEVTLTNNVQLSASLRPAYALGGSGTATVSGSNNFGGSTNPFPAAIQGSPYPVTASTAYDPGAGDFALYVSSTGQLLDSPHNDVIGGGVGPTVNADVPTTDIVGRARTGGSANPGAFALAQATRVIGKTIGPVGRDYATFTAAEADVENIGGSADLVFENEAIEFLADAATYAENVTFQSSLTTDATRQVTYKPASGSEHGGDKTAGVILHGGQLVYDNFTALSGLVLAANSTAYAHAPVNMSNTSYSYLGVGFSACLFVADLAGTGYGIKIFRSSGTGTHGSAAAPVVLQNCTFHNIGIHAISLGGPGGTATINDYVEVLNCTFVSEKPGANSTAIGIFDCNGSLSLKIVNCLNLGIDNDSAVGQVSTLAVTTTGSAGNFGRQSLASWQFPGKGSPYPITPTTNTDPGPGHFAIYTAATGALVNVAANTVWQRGVGPSVNSDVPTTDIAGFPRSGATANPGAFAASTALAATTNPVARFFTYKRPSTQVFNHHRRITCVFPDDGPSGNGNTFAVGVAARGFISPISRDCVAFFVYYTTDGAGVQTSLRLEVARLLGPYSQDTIAEAQPIAVIEKQAVGEAIPAGFNFPGQSHTVAFKVQTFSGATTPESAAEYTAFIDGTAVTFDTFYQSSTQDGTTKVVTHPAPAVGTTQGRAEAFFWYATADRVDSSGSENYTLPQWSAWTQLAVDPDPLFDGDGETVAVLGEGTGTINLSTAVEHVDWNISIQYELPRFDVPFASGHRYTSPRFANARRLITASATNVDKATMDLIVQFHAARKGIEDPFLFNFPIPATMASETYTVITVQFADQNGMVYRREAENIYSVQLNLIELL